MNAALEFRGIRKSFGEKEVLTGVDFRILPGEIAFILGVSGTGKSVLLKILVGLLKADAGSVQIGGMEVGGLTEEGWLEVRKTCGMVFQHPALFDSLTVFENIAYGLRRLRVPEEEIRTRVEEALGLVHLPGVEQKFPWDISFGMQKRVSLARTLVMRPGILLFDEPTTGLDPVTTGAVNDLIRELSRKLKTTSVVVSHDMKSALELADRILMLDGGRVVAQGTPDEMMKSAHPLVEEFLAELKEAQA
jgi:phospholipid/cholesterol/gamma-HCH transport system ATP-binding protein